MSIANEFRQLELEVSAVERAIEAETSFVKKTARVSVAVGVAIVVAMAAFAATNYFHIRTAFSTERLAASLSEEVATISPTAARELEQLGQNLLPVYAAELSRQVEACWPEIAARLEREANELSTGILATAHKTLSASEARVLAALESTLAQTYPGLTDPVEQERLRQRVEIACKAAIGESIASFEELYAKDISRLQNCLLQFDVSDTAESTPELQKRFIHLWLQLLDQEITEL